MPDDFGKSLSECFDNLSRETGKVVRLLMVLQSDLAEQNYSNGDPNLTANLVVRARGLEDMATQIQIMCIRQWLNMTLYEHFARAPKIDDSLEKKKEFTSQLNATLRDARAAIVDETQRVPRTPKILVVSKSRDGKGRYSFEDRETKKRSGSYESLSVLLPLNIMKDIPRDRSPRKKRDPSST